MLFTVVIICHNEAHSIEQTIEHVLNQDFPKTEYEVLVAVNKSSDQTEELVERYDVRRIFFEENYYASAIRNVAVQEANGQYIFFLDGHMLLEPNALANARKWFTDPSIGALCGTYYTPYSNLEAIRDIRYKAKSRKYRAGKPIRITYDNFYTFTGGICAFRKDVLERVKGFDFSFYREACEDVYVELKVLSLGYDVIYDPGIIALHNHKHPSLRGFFYRAIRWEPCGLYKLIQRGITDGYSVPYDHYILRIPTTTAVFLTTLILSIGDWRTWPYLLVGSLLQIIEIWRFYLQREHKLRFRFFASLYWILINITRLVWLPLILIHPPVVFAETMILKGTKREMDGSSRQVTYETKVEREQVSYLTLVSGTLKNIGKMAKEVIVDWRRWIREI